MKITYKSFLFITLFTFIALANKTTTPVQPQVQVPKEPISKEEFFKALTFISYAEGHRTYQTILNLPKERINAEQFLKGFSEAKEGKTYQPNLEKLRKAHQTLMFYKTQQQQKQEKENKQAITAYENDSNKINLKDKQTYRIKKKGQGRKIKKDDQILIHYKGFFRSGKIFQDSYQLKQPILLQVGDGQVIEGWTRLLTNLKEGDIAETYIPASLGYGDVANGPIPANSDLFFVIEVVKILPKNSATK